MKKITLVASIALAVATSAVIAADIPATSTSAKDSLRADPHRVDTPRIKVPAARGPALELAIQAARVAIETCAAAGGQQIGASVVDSAGILKVLLAADGTSPRGVQSSTNKAVTALTFKSATVELYEKINFDKTLADKIAANPNQNARPGGVLIKVGDEIIGAIGVGGGSTDHDCAVAGINKIQSQLK